MIIESTKVDIAYYTYCRESNYLHEQMNYIIQYYCIWNLIANLTWQKQGIQMSLEPELLNVSKYKIVLTLSNHNGMDKIIKCNFWSWFSHNSYGLIN